MRGTILHAPGDVRYEERPDPTILGPTDAIVRTVAVCVCGSDLWPYRGIDQVIEPRANTWLASSAPPRSWPSEATLVSPASRSSPTGSVPRRPRMCRHRRVDVAGAPLDPTRRNGRHSRRPARRGGSDRGPVLAEPRTARRPAPVRSYLPDLLRPGLEPADRAGKVFDVELPLEQVADAYQAMDERRAIKALLWP